MTRRRKSVPLKSADIFARTKRASSGTRRPGRPPVHEEAWTKVTVVLFNRQIVFLDRLAANIRAFADAVNKAKPAGAKGHYINRVAISSTMGPGVKVDTASLSLIGNAGGT